MSLLVTVAYSNRGSPRRPPIDARQGQRCRCGA